MIKIEDLKLGQLIWDSKSGLSGRINAIDCSCCGYDEIENYEIKFWVNSKFISTRLKHISLCPPTKLVKKEGIMIMYTNSIGVQIGTVFSSKEDIPNNLRGYPILKVTWEVEE